MTSDNPCINIENSFENCPLRFSKTKEPKGFRLQKLIAWESSLPAGQGAFPAIYVRVFQISAEFGFRSDMRQFAIISRLFAIVLMRIISNRWILLNKWFDWLRSWTPGIPHALDEANAYIERRALFIHNYPTPHQAIAGRFFLHQKRPPSILIFENGTGVSGYD